MFFETFSNRSVYPVKWWEYNRALSSTNFRALYIATTAVGWPAECFCQMWKNLQFKTSSSFPNIYIINVLYLAQILLLQFTIQKLSDFSFEKIVESMFFLIFCGWVFNFFGTDFSCSGVGITGQILIVPLWDFSSQKWSLVF